MAKDKSKKKKVIKTVSTKDAGGLTTNSNKKKVSTKRPKVAKSSLRSETVQMPFGKKNFQIIGIGLALLALGFIMMLGGYNEDPNVWDPNVIYSKRITILAPLLILAGLGVQIYAIFKK